MISAANADGHIDARERQKIAEQLQLLDDTGEIAALIEQRLQHPLNLDDIAKRSDSAETDAEIYLISRIVVDADKPADADYLQSLADALDLSPKLIAEIEAEAGSA